MSAGFPLTSRFFKESNESNCVCLGWYRQCTTIKDKAARAIIVNAIAGINSICIGEVTFLASFRSGYSLDGRRSKRLQSGDMNSINQGNELADTGLVFCVVTIFLTEPPLFSAGFNVEEDEEHQSQQQGEQAVGQ